MLAYPVVESAAGLQMAATGRARGRAIGEIGKRCDHAFRRDVAEAEATQTRCVDEPADAVPAIPVPDVSRPAVRGQPQGDRRGGRVPAPPGHRIHYAHRPPRVRDQGVDKGRLADPRLTDEHADPVGQGGVQVGEFGGGYWGVAPPGWFGGGYWGVAPP